MRSGSVHRKTKYSMRWQILGLTLLPLFLVTVITMAVALRGMRSSLQSETAMGLEELANSLLAGICTLDPGEWILYEGKLYKGAVCLSENQNILNRFMSDRTQASLYYQNTSYVTTLVSEQDGNKMTGIGAFGDAAEQVLDKGEVYHDIVMIGDMRYYACYIPVTKVSDQGIAGMLFVGKPAEDIDKLIQDKINHIAFVAILLTGIACIICIVISNKMARRIMQAENVIYQLSEGNLKADLSKNLMTKRDEIGKMMQALGNLKVSLTEIVKGITESSGKLSQTGMKLDIIAEKTSRTVLDISESTAGISTGTALQADRLKNIVCQIEDMGMQIQDIVSGAERLDEVSARMQLSGENSRMILRELSESNSAAVMAMRDIEQQIYATNEEVEKILTAVEGITEIVDQTRLLSLNASIEAARAGTQGKGFGVVATEIQKLADMSASFAHEIEQNVNRLHHESEKSVFDMGQTKQAVEQQNTRLGETLNHFVIVLNGIESFRTETVGIKEQTDVCNVSRQAVVDAVNQLSVISQQNADSSGQTAESMEHLKAVMHQMTEGAVSMKGLSAMLEERIRIFKLQ